MLFSHEGLTAAVLLSGFHERMLAVLLLTLAGAALAVPPTENGLLLRVIQAVDKALHFFAEDYSAINVDGLFGLRLGQGGTSSCVNITHYLEVKIWEAI